jgi:hypothetical protein
MSRYFSVCDLYCRLVDETFSLVVLSDLQKAASVQAMLVDFLGENCGHF